MFAALAVVHMFVVAFFWELSLYIDFELIWPWVNMIFAALWVAFAIPLGIKFGFGLLQKVFNAIGSALGS